MKSKSRNILFSLVASLLISTVAFAASEEKLDHDYSILSVFVQPSISFLSFTEREYFQNAIDSLYYNFKAEAVNDAESLNVAKQDFQKVNFCFPITAGIQWQFMEDHFLSTGIGFIYDNESVVLTDRKSGTHSYEYTLQGVPLFLEYRFALPKNFITLSTGGLFSVSVRWYWVLPGTEIYTTWGKLDAETPLLGAGFGVSVGYLFASWDNFKLYGDIGFSSISVKSNKKFSDIVDGGPEEKAKWNLGGLQMQIRGTFGFWNKPKPKDDEDDDDDDDDKPKKRKKNSLGNLADSLKAVAKTSAAQDTANVDSAKVAADSASAADTTKVNVADSLGAAKDSVKNVADSLNKNVAVDTAKTGVADSTSAAKDTVKNVAESKNIADSLIKNIAADSTAKTAADSTAKAPVMKIAPAAPATPAKQPEEKPVETTVNATTEKDTTTAPATEVKSKGD
jgi:hypothetical protein